MTRPRVVIIGPCADPTDVGEALSTWRWTRGLSERVDVTLLTYVKAGRESAARSLPGVRAIEWNDLPIPSRLERLNAALQPGYGLFYMRARRWLKQAITDGARFDLAHQLAPLALRYPSPAAGLGLPVVVGPLAGSLTTPRMFEQETSGEPWFIKLRRLDRFRLRHDPLLRGTYESAAVVIGVAPYVREILGELEMQEFVVESETGIPELPPAPSRDFASRPFRLLYVGRVVRPKGVRDIIRALGQIPDLDVILDVVGVGNDLDACRTEAARLGVADRVQFHGRLQREAVDEYYAAAHAFVFPSFREPSGNVVLEAMSWGLPMIVADRGGPAHAVGSDAGIRVSVETPEQFARDIARAIRSLVTNPQLAHSHGEAARRITARDHLWPAKIDRMVSLYGTVIEAAG
jgi:glycosyltransferase involved in cell wall biosynthesis